MAAPPPPLHLNGPTAIVPGVTAYLESDVPAGTGESVYLLASTRGPGRGPCLPALGGRCLGILAPRLVATTEAYEMTPSLWEITLPPGFPSGGYVTFQAVLVRGYNGADTWMSDVTPVPVQPCVGDATTGDTDGDLTCDAEDPCPNDANDACMQVSCLVDFEDGWQYGGEGAPWYAVYDNLFFDIDGGMLVGGLANGDSYGLGVDGTASPAYMAFTDAAMYASHATDLEFDLFPTNTPSTVAWSVDGGAFTLVSFTPGQAPVTVTEPGYFSEVRLQATAPAGLDRIAFTSVNGQCPTLGFGP